MRRYRIGEGDLGSSAIVHSIVHDQADTNCLKKSTQLSTVKPALSTLQTHRMPNENPNASIASLSVESSAGKQKQRLVYFQAIVRQLQEDSVRAVQREFGPHQNSPNSRDHQ